MLLAGILVIVMGALVKLNLLELDGSALFPRETPALAEAEAVTFIGPEELKRRLDLGENLVVADVRRRASYDKLHLAGAVPLPMENHPSWGPSLALDRPLVLYCACENDETSAEAARVIRARYRHNQVMVLKGGLGAWVDSGYPIVERKLPEGLQRMKVKSGA
jgi:adenylyltransferase/sulfurtransferase